MPSVLSPLFHNCMRRTIGLAETKGREWLLDIEYRKRETFAYACEAYLPIDVTKITRDNAGSGCSLRPSDARSAERRSRC